MRWPGVAIASTGLLFSARCTSDKNVRYLHRKVQGLAKTRGLECRVDEKRGKGSHVTLYFGDRMTVVRNPKDELKTGTLRTMYKQLEIRRDEL